MAGFWNRSQSQIQDVNGKPLVGARAFFYLGGTTTPMNIYGDYSLGDINLLPNPIVSDGFGFFPSVFFDEDDDFYHVRITTPGGVVILDVDGLPIIGKSGGGGGGSVSPVNPDSVLTTGDVKIRYDDGFLPGFVRLNGKSIGSAISGASERANADCEALFGYLWNKDANLPVLGGRGANSAADWTANKQISLPDARGATMIGLDTMGNTAANVVGDASALGWKGGETEHTLVTSEMPYHAHGGSTNPGGAHTHFSFSADMTIGPDLSSTNYPSRRAVVSGQTDPVIRGSTVAPTIGVTSQAPDFRLQILGEGGGVAHNNLQASMAITYYIRL